MKTVFAYILKSEDRTLTEDEVRTLLLRNGALAIDDKFRSQVVDEAPEYSEEGIRELRRGLELADDDLLEVFVMGTQRIPGVPIGDLMSALIGLIGSPNCEACPQRASCPIFMATQEFEDCGDPDCPTCGLRHTTH